MLAWMINNPGMASGLVWLVALIVAWVINWAIITQAYKPRSIGRGAQYLKVNRAAVGGLVAHTGLVALATRKQCTWPELLVATVLDRIAIPAADAVAIPSRDSGGLLYVPKLLQICSPNCTASFWLTHC